MTDYDLAQAAKRIIDRLPRGLNAFEEGDRVQTEKGGPFETVTKVYGFESRLMFGKKLREVGVWVVSLAPEGKKRGRKVPILVPGNEEAKA